MGKDSNIWFVIRLYAEVVIWLGALVWLASSSADFSAHAALCPFKSLGWSFCPGCGLGRSIILLFHGEFAESLSMHWLGLPVILVFIWRIVTLLKKNRQILRHLKPFKSIKINKP
ncbi:MAG TPA: DUF2752 domain-containing protein [Bacteroidales bacterium]|nr:MAG: hypothetical protein A2X11_08865 [Bacteroidetes bacterium GWE2_42_24]OFY29942.1 MAG: hypothetical protein A2X09_15740 [Bacteroidetes bacterium GWF2_43_11]HBZ67872.1 DUF2752 domain-containing protein [Bacteroidales bacterium]